MTVDEAERLRPVLGAFYKTIDVMKSARNSESKTMSVWADDMKAVEDVMFFLEQLRDTGVPALASWQPIETAPKDGPIMLCVAGYLPCVGRWWPVDSCWTSFDWEGHFESDKETSEYVNGSSYEPTHWQPLPPGPSVSSTDGGGK